MKKDEERLTKTDYRLVLQLKVSWTRKRAPRLWPHELLDLGLGASLRVRTAAIAIVRRGVASSSHCVNGKSATVPQPIPPGTNWASRAHPGKTDPAALATACL